MPKLSEDVERRIDECRLRAPLRSLLKDFLHAAVEVDANVAVQIGCDRWKALEIVRKGRSVARVFPKKALLVKINNFLPDDRSNLYGSDVRLTNRKRTEWVFALESEAGTERMLRCLSENIAAHLRGAPTNSPQQAGIDDADLHLPDELGGNGEYVEGAGRTITVNAYERSAAARRACIEHWGTCCCVCGFDFAAVYGERGEGYIHVHHLVPQAEIREAYRVNPIEDLLPICPNCHAMIHRHEPLLTVEQLRLLVSRRRTTS